jgi:hypothetical protein
MRVRISRTQISLAVVDWQRDGVFDDAGAPLSGSFVGTGEPTEARTPASRDDRRRYRKFSTSMRSDCDSVFTYRIQRPSGETDIPPQ